jgi:hypothetical protein
MSKEGTGLVESMKAAADLSGKQHLGMTLTDSDTVNVPAAANDFCVGVLQNKPAAAGRGARCKVGFVKFRAGGALSAGDPMTMAASGYFTTATSGTRQVGQCMRDVTSGYLGFGFVWPTAFMSATSVEAGVI